tara:strand:- start:1067 stop:1897 length:831 start_codon:yes stop_codon:yes gene_type:complete
MLAGVKLPHMECRLSEISNCHLCNSPNELQDSHIIPRSYFKSLKGKSGQLITVSTDESIRAKLSNADPKEKLLCSDCEQHIGRNFEQYGTRLFKDHCKVTRTKEVVIFNQFRFKEFYLFLISILWRASISSLPRYKHIDLGIKFNNLLRHCLKENTLKIQTSLRLDYFFKISVIRIIDKTMQLNDNEIKKTLFDFNYEKGASLDDGMLWYFMVDGFLIIYHLYPEKDINIIRTKRNYAQITNKQRMAVPISDISNFKQLVAGFSSMTKQAVARNKR